MVGERLFRYPEDFFGRELVAEREPKVLESHSPAPSDEVVEGGAEARPHPQGEAMRG
jgi:hypothetical protein